jgi:hypothetical protein
MTDEAMSDYDEQDRRIAMILGEDDVVEVNATTLRIYLDYLMKNINLPCHLTGIDEFAWEERFVFGHGSKAEYEKLKKTQPSHTDTYELLGFNDTVKEDYGIVVYVKRLSDKRKFTLPLADLKATDEKSDNYKFLDDFSAWFVNYM